MGDSNSNTKPQPTTDAIALTDDWVIARDSTGEWAVEFIAELDAAIIRQIREIKRAADLERFARELHYDSHEARERAADHLVDNLVPWRLDVTTTSEATR